MEERKREGEKEKKGEKKKKSHRALMLAPVEWRSVAAIGGGGGRMSCGVVEEERREKFFICVWAFAACILKKVCRVF